ncbi:KH domain-containing, RNA-binding, signal transduction-associated protein 2 [Eupeodes corollae]|uniref:KH domain-containing, RNA-binding, signal transduction-associated protein 2 n=1 Tax=Eupeodes corollae TaxID=290404 RepID=UPI00249181D8|nr:KH domain-containing, RNA-binding, signal transduction-associated protein 2 [Eupeodes corollae]
MPRSYDRNEYNDETEYKRKHREEEGSSSHHQQSDAIPLNEKTNEYLQDCLSEKKSVDKKYPICKKLLDTEIEKVLVSSRIPRAETFANVYSEKPIRISQKVIFPIRDYPKFNFVGKILGPKGNTLRQLQEHTQCKMIILGRNSMRDHDKEEELRSSGDPKYNHLSRDLHVEISTVAPPSEAYARLAYALAEIRKFLVPDSNDEIRQEQMRVMDIGKEKPYKHPVSRSYGAPYHGGSRSPPPPPSFDKASKPKVYSILEKARYAMDDPYPVSKSRPREHDPYDHDDYGRYSPPPKHSSSHGHYEGSSYERGEYRREHPSSYSHSGYPKTSNGRSSAYRPTSSNHYESGSRSRENVRYRTAPYPRVR